MQILLLLSALAWAGDAAEVVRTAQVERGQPQAAVVISVDRAIDEWQKWTKIEVAANAKNAITEELSAFASMGMSQRTTTFMTRAYLYEVRDWKARAEGAPTKLALEDVQGYNVNTFVRMTAIGKKVGYLRCVSKPEGGKISIDGEARGETIKEFVLSTGKHMVAIDLPKRRCKEDVLIEEEKLKETRCPPQ